MTYPVARDLAAGPRYRLEALEAFYDSFRAASIDFAVFLPDSLLDGLEQLILERGEIECFQCAREDEGVAMAMGAYLVGRRPLVMMEGSGIGLSALILARGIVQRTPTLLVASHSNTLGECFDYHAATRVVAEPVLRALNIPYYVLFDPTQIRTVVIEAQRTVEGQKVPVAILVPPHVIRAA
ncbi:MAG TPA: thiamine pyrophosphate-binding protein [Chloroflexota bacterium]|jgi:sulfopyruvate decarboxylase TPP-binding subunit|nr:thiamine pyrophosphate-binding protein [Chloroflexota bacterium]